MHCVVRRSVGLAECQADCAAEATCACAYIRDDGRDTFWCSLSTVPCNNTELGAQPDFTGVRSAIFKCDYGAAPASLQATWPAMGEPQVDWGAPRAPCCSYRAGERLVQKTLRVSCMLEAVRACIPLFRAMSCVGQASRQALRQRSCAVQLESGTTHVLPANPTTASRLRCRCYFLSMRCTAYGSGIKHDKSPVETVEEDGKREGGGGRRTQIASPRARQPAWCAPKRLAHQP